MDIFNMFFGGGFPVEFDAETFFVIDKGHLISLDDLEVHPCKIIIPPQYPDENTYLVYGLYDPIQKEVFYIGKTKNFKERMRQHCRVTRFNPRIVRPFGDYRLNDRKIEIYDAGGIIQATVLAICPADYLVSAVEAALIHYYRYSILNVQMKHDVMKGWEYDFD